MLTVLKIMFFKYNPLSIYKEIKIIIYCNINNMKVEINYLAMLNII